MLKNAERAANIACVRYVGSEYESSAGAYPVRLEHSWCIAAPGMFEGRIAGTDCGTHQPQNFAKFDIYFSRYYVYAE
jgi:hypothetical protein